MSDTTTLSKNTEKVKKPNMYKVILWNDDYTPWNFVAGLLVAFFNKSEQEAITITKMVHEQGKGLAGIYTKDIATTKVKQAEKSSKDFGFPLKVTEEKE